MATSPASSMEVLEEVGVASEQSHLTQVVVGVPPEDREEGEEGAVPVSLVTEEDPAEILRQVLCVLKLFANSLVLSDWQKFLDARFI